MQKLNFLLWPALAGLLAALLILDRWVLPAIGNRGTFEYEPVSYANAVRLATPAVVNIYTVVESIHTDMVVYFTPRYSMTWFCHEPEMVCVADSESCLHASVMLESQTPHDAD